MIQTRTPIVSAKVIKKSVAPNGKIITTFQLRYPRWIHAEQRTHRQLATSEEFVTPSLMEDVDLSRNASSSRAIPVSKLIQDVIEDPAIPAFWGKNQKGMQAGEEIDELVSTRRVIMKYVDKVTKWLDARDSAIEHARDYDAAGYHKQIVNRLLEPYSKINVVVSATEWSNFYALRDHKDAEPHIALLARAMKVADESAECVPVDFGEWHLPYVTPMDIASLGHDWDKLCLVSAARCARVSYVTHDGREPDLKEDLILADRLIGAVPLHASPAEHQATPAQFADTRSGNFLGFTQFRKTLPGECQ